MACLYFIVGLFHPPVGVCANAVCKTVYACCEFSLKYFVEISNKKVVFISQQTPHRRKDLDNHST